MEYRVPNPRDVRIRLSVCIAAIMLSFDFLNPVKVLSEVFNVNQQLFGILSTIALIAIVYANAKDLLYFFTKVFLQSIFSIFFSSIEVLGKQNIPMHGPIIFTGNHMNQFVDAVLILITCPHRVGFLIAEKSFNHPVVGGLAKAIGCYPVARPQDTAKKGTGQLTFEGLNVIGKGTNFLTVLKKGDKIRPGRSANAYRVVEVTSDTSALLGEDFGEPSPTEETYCNEGKYVEYDVFPYIFQGKMFEVVEAELGQGNNLGIFPEGGSHDNTDLLPLKAGVSAITFGVLEKFDINVPIVPVGLNYFRGHRFRGRAVVEFGEPIRVTKSLQDTYKISKRSAYRTLLSQVEDGMRSVLVTAPNYEELKLIHTVRRLYQRAGSLSTYQKQDLSRRFATAYRVLREKYKDGLPDDLSELQKRIESYQDELDKWGLRDYQVTTSLVDLSFSKVLYIFLHAFVVMTLASIPSLILNFPVGAAARYWSISEAKKDLQKSRVKVAAKDVLLSKKITFSLVAVPVLWITYAILLFVFTKWETRTIILILLCFPIFSYVGVMAVEAGMIDMKDLRPAFLRLLPNYRQHISVLPGIRSQLQTEVRAVVKKYGPEFGLLYTDKTSSWDAMLRKTSSNAGLSELAGSGLWSNNDNKKQS